MIPPAPLRRLAVLSLVTISGISPAGLPAQTEPYFASQDFHDTFAEMKQPAIRPSRIGGGRLLKEPLPAVRLETSETAEHLLIETDLWRMEVQKETGSLRLLNKQTGAEWNLAGTDSHTAGFWWETGPAGEKSLAISNLAKIHRIRRNGNQWDMQADVGTTPDAVNIEIAVLAPNVLRFSLGAPTSVPAARVGLSLLAEGPFFGLGERYVRAKLDGLKTTLRTSDNFGEELAALKPQGPPKETGPGHNWTYVPVPFLFSPRGLGLYIDTTWPSTFDLEQSDRKQVSVQLGGPSADCYFFVASDPKGMVGAYTSLMGRSPMPPPWAFGVWVNITKGIRDLGGFFNNSGLDEAMRLRQNGIPASAVWIQDFLAPTMNVGWSLWTLGFYGSPRQLTDDLHKLGFKALVYTNPMVFSKLAPYLIPNPTYETGARESNFIVDPNRKKSPLDDAVGMSAGIVDFTKPEAARWWEEMKMSTITEYGFDGWMEDFGENVRDTDQLASGKSALELANVYPLLYHKMSYEAARRVKPDVVEFSRSGYAGSQAFTPVLWGGDQFPNWSTNMGLPSVVSAGITAGLSGYAVWGPDIQCVSPSKEMWIRSLEFGALSPVMRDHKWDQPKWAVDLWFDAETTDLFRRYARLHVSLFPYLYTYAHQIQATGLPIMRHLMLEYPDDPRAWEVENEYLLGEKVLVAPVLAEGAVTRSLYLPKGSWMDYWTDELIEGGRQVEVPAPLDRIPILVRAGSVIPLIDGDTQTLASDLPGLKIQTLNNSLIWRIIPAAGTARGEFTLYDGTKASAEQHDSAIEVRGEGSPVLRQYEIVLSAAGKPASVVLSGEELTQLDDAGYKVRKKGWWMSTDRRSLHVLFLGNDFTLNVVNR